jgi:hypothetical protein
VILALAPVSKPIQSSPQEEVKHVEEPIDEIEALDNEPELERPRISLPMQGSTEGSEEGSPDIPPPRLSIPFDDDDKSVEFPRRDLAIRDQEQIAMMRRDLRVSEDFGDTQLESDSDAGEETGIIIDDGFGDDTMISGGEFDRG